MAAREKARHQENEMRKKGILANEEKLFAHELLKFVKKNGPNNHMPELQPGDVLVCFSEDLRYVYISPGKTIDLELGMNYAQGDYTRCCDMKTGVFIEEDGCDWNDIWYIWRDGDIIWNAKATEEVA